MNMERHRCKLCFRNFSNGRALGGHMRSHMMILSPASKNSSIIHSCSSSQGEVVLHDGESDAESSKRPGKTAPSKAGDTYTNEELSSVSDITAEEDVAHCLMMLSRDRWEKENEEEGGGDDDDVSEDSSPLKKVKRANPKVRGKYKCETCNKLFKSYQALGGHRASYKKIKADTAATAPGGGAPAAEERVHECPFCHRVFASGQALGGHKRSHFIGSTSNFTTNFSKVSRIGENFDTIIDLNLPAPVDDGDEINFSD